jgi:hypothetical protein
MQRVEVLFQVERHLAAQVKATAGDGFRITHVIVELPARDAARPELK